MDETRITDKGYKISVSLSDYFRTVEDMFGEGYEFRYSNRDMQGATTNAVKDIPEEVFEIVFGIYDFDPEYDGDGTQEYYKSQAEELKQKYYIYPVNVYEHSTYAFSLGTDDKETLKRYGIDGVLLLDKKIREGGTFCEDLKAINHFLHNDYSDYMNGRVYNISIYKPHKRRDDEGDEMTTRDYVDGMDGFLRDYVDDEYKDYFESEYGKLEKPFKS